MLSIRRPGLPFALDLAWPLLVWFTERIFKEDRGIVEVEQAAHDQQGADWNHEVFPVIRDLRDLLRECGGRTVIPIQKIRTPSQPSTFAITTPTRFPASV